MMKRCQPFRLYYRRSLYLVDRCHFSCYSFFMHVFLCISFSFESFSLSLRRFLSPPSACLCYLCSPSAPSASLSHVARFLLLLSPIQTLYILCIVSYWFTCIYVYTSLFVHLTLLPSHHLSTYDGVWSGLRSRTVNSRMWQT